MPSGSKFAQALMVLEILEGAAVAIARIAQRRAKSRPRVRRGGTLRPGPDTPLWLALVARVRPYLRDYGAKSRLARELGLDPSRVSEFFVTRTAQPDAERTLELMIWLGRQPLLNTQRLVELAAIVPAGRDRRK